MTEPLTDAARELRRMAREQVDRDLLIAIADTLDRIARDDDERWPHWLHRTPDGLRIVDRD